VNSRKPWSATDLADLKLAINEGWTLSDAASFLCRSEIAGTVIAHALMGKPAFVRDFEAARVELRQELGYPAEPVAVGSGEAKIVDLKIYPYSAGAAGPIKPSSSFTSTRNKGDVKCGSDCPPTGLGRGGPTTAFNAGS
jgi:hypothetical protein